MMICCYKNKSKSLYEYVDFQKETCVVKTFYEFPSWLYNAYFSLDFFFKGLTKKVNDF